MGMGRTGWVMDRLGYMIVIDVGDTTFRIATSHACGTYGYDRVPCLP